MGAFTILFIVSIIGFETMFSQFQEKGIDEIYCLSVNDYTVMNSWFEAQGVENVVVAFIGWQRRIH